MRSFERFLVYIAAVFAMLAWLTARRAPGRAADAIAHDRIARQGSNAGGAAETPGDVIAARRARPAREPRRIQGGWRQAQLMTSSRGSDWPQPSWN